MFKKIVLLVLFLPLFSCGGGGGGSNESGGNVSFYGGVWDFTGLVIDDPCGISKGQPSLLTLNVNQEDKKVVVDAGQLHLEGETSNQDGFTVSGGHRGDDNCLNGYAISFKDASDGKADLAGYSVTIQCANVRCSVTYGGVAERR